jgi:hypothetical protein
MASIAQDNGSNVAFMNTTESVEENTWYTVTENITESGITATLYGSDGNLIKSMATAVDTLNSNKMAMLIANNVDSAVVFKDLIVQTQNSTARTPENTEKTTTNDGGSSAQYVNLSILLVTTFAAAIVYVKKKRQIKAAKISANLPATRR